MRAPVIVTGSARSGTSLTVGCLFHCGLQLGNTCGKTPWNEKGQFENRPLIQAIEKPYLESIGVDPAGQYPLPEDTDIVPDPGRRERALEILQKQGVSLDRPWGFKDAKALLDWEPWHDAFPDALWVVTRRPTDQVARSCLRTRFMRSRDTYESWVEWHQHHESRARSLERYNRDRVIRVDTEELSHGRMDQIQRVLTYAGLQFNARRVREFVTPDLWHFGERDDAAHGTG